MNPLQPIASFRSTGYIPLTSLAYAPQKYACHITHVFHCTAMVVCILSHVTAYIGENPTNCNSYLPHYWSTCANNKYAPQMPHMPISACADEIAVSIYSSYELTAVNSVS